MFNLYVLVDLIVVIGLAVLGLTVLLQNKKVELNRIFAAFVVCVAVWIIANYISNDTSQSPRTAVIANYFVFIFSYGAAAYILRFSMNLAGDKKAIKIWKKLSIPVILIGLSAFTPFVVKGVALQDNVYAVRFGYGLPVYAFGLLSLIITTFFVLARNLRLATGNQKARIKVLFISLCGALPLVVLMNFIIPTLTGWFGLTNIGILPMLLLVFGFYYGVAKHRLFDLRFFVVRSLAYVLSLGLLSLVYALVSTVITSLLSFATKRPYVNDLLHAVLILIIAINYEPLKKIFRKLTDRFFYQDAYDPQVFLDELNKAVLATLELQPLLENVTKIIEKNLKVEFSTFGLKETKYDGKRIIGEKAQRYTHEDIAKIQSLTQSLNERVIITDSFQESNPHIYSSLNNLKVGAVALLTSSSKHEAQRIGFLILGAKKSGNPYNKQDVQTLDIIADELIIAIQNALRFEEIENFNVTLQEKVDKATYQLRKANERLKALDETKDDFISMASHQLRTPLTSVKGYVSMVIEGDAGKVSTQQKKLLEQAFMSSQRMVNLIADLLNVSRLKTGKFVIDQAPTNLADMIKEEIDQLKETAKAHSLELSFTAPEHFPALLLDETKTRQVIMNFIDNAIYYTPAGGHIKVELHDKPSSIELNVSDDGIGVPKAEQHHLFTKFYRAANARKARPDGTGLGLFMAKKVVAAEGGAIIFTSVEGKGSTFGFTFPKTLLAKAAPKS